METQNIIVISLLILAIVIIVLFYKTPKNNSKCEDMEDMIELPIIFADDSDDKQKLITHAENFSNISFQPDYAWLSRYNLLPWWNSTRHTRNSSYDLRGDVPIIPSYVGPWNNSDMI